MRAAARNLRAVAPPARCSSASVSCKIHAKLCSIRLSRRSCVGVVAAASFADVQPTPVAVDGQPADLPPKSGVYAVYDQASTLKYIGISRNIHLSVASHASRVGEAVHSVKLNVIDNATKEELTNAWKEWLNDAVSESGIVPPGNVAPGKELWQGKPKKSIKQEIKLTSGKGADDLTCNIKDLVDMVVKNERVVAFVKGTRTQPQCGFSHQMLSTLNAMRTEYEVVNVLDEVFNPGLRDAIKEYSAWPTIPQLYIDGEFVGGSDIVQEMAGNGELAKLVKAQ